MADPIKPRPGQLWQHHSGRRYWVVAIANDVPDPKPDYPPTVVYLGPNGKMWAGRLDDWHRRMAFVGDYRVEFDPLTGRVWPPSTR